MMTADTRTGAPGTAGRVLIVDDEPSILSALRRLLRQHGFEVLQAGSGREGLETLGRETVDVVLSDMRMPEMDGAQFLEQVFTRWPETKRILLTGYSDVESTVAAVNRGKIWRYIAKPWNDDDLVVTLQQAIGHRHLIRENARLLDLTQDQNDELKTLNSSLEQKVAQRTAELAEALKSLESAHGQLRQGFLASVQLFSGLIELRGGKMAGHSRRVANLSRRLAEQMELSDADQQDVFLAALLHDIGKLGLSDTLLNAPFNSLTAQGKTEVMRHPVKGQQVLTAVEQLASASKIIRHHHESFDGSGYPDRLAGLAIPLGSRIIAVANDYDGLQTGALTLHAHSALEAQQFLHKQRSLRYDPEVVDAFFALLRKEEANRPRELALKVAQLRPGMVLAADLMHRDGYTLLPHGRSLTTEVIGRLASLEQAEGSELSVLVKNDVGPGVLRDPRAAEPPPRLWKELALGPERLKAGMVLSRNLNHKEGYLLLARGKALDDSVIRQIREFARANEHEMKVYIRVEA